MHLKSLERTHLDHVYVHGGAHFRSCSLPVTFFPEKPKSYFSSRRFKVTGVRRKVVIESNRTCADLFVKNFYEKELWTCIEDFQKMSALVSPLAILYPLRTRIQRVILCERKAPLRCFLVLDNPRRFPERERQWITASGFQSELIFHDPTSPHLSRRMAGFFLKTTV